MRPRLRVGIIAGTGVAEGIDGAQLVRVATPWGEIEVAHARQDDIDLFFVQRHGRARLAPHRIVHRANVEALARCGVDAVFAVNAVGALDPALVVPSLLVPDDLIDLRKTTETFHDRAIHVDMTHPYCPVLRALLVRHAGATDGGTYVAVEGPRLETPAEIRMLRALGGSVVGMTGCPEAALARERALCYASLCLVTNAATGVAAAPLSAAAIQRGAAELAPRALAGVLAAAREVRPERACACRRALEGAALS